MTAVPEADTMRSSGEAVPSSQRSPAGGDSIGRGAHVLQLIDITKTYPGIKALDSASLTLDSGEIHALVGENGAGKSTMIQVIAGVHRPDAGRFLIDGEPAKIMNPRDAFRARISVVHQERSLVPTFSVGENVLLERVVSRAASYVDKKRVEREAAPLMEKVGLHVSPERRVESLSVAQKQLIEIARGLSINARIILLDEPTASISLKEASALLETLRRLRDQGTAILFVSHKLEEVFEVCDSVTVLRDGRNAGPTSPVRTVDRSRVVELMIGRAERSEALQARTPQRRATVLEVVDRPSSATVEGSSFVLHGGEILGWYGLVGAGRTELARSIIGIDAIKGGSILVRGQHAHIRSLADALERWRIGYVTENRQEEGLFLGHSVQRNLAATVWRRLTNRVGLLDLVKERELARRYRDTLEIKAPSLAQTVGNLSGGNRQKVNFAKWLAAEPEILIIDEPTVGIDIKTKYEIHRLIWDLAEQGISIILISSDMPEIIRLADRILVFRLGRIVGEVVNTKEYEAMSRAVMSSIIPTAGNGQADQTPAWTDPMVRPN